MTSSPLIFLLFGLLFQSSLQTDSYEQALKLAKLEICSKYLICQSVYLRPCIHDDQLVSSRISIQNGLVTEKKTL